MKIDYKYQDVIDSGNLKKSSLFKMIISIFLIIFFFIRCDVLKNKKDVDLDFQKLIKPVERFSILSDSSYYTWGASMVEGPSGQYNLYYSRWPRNLGHNAWVTHSQIAHAISDNPLGPYVFRDVVLPARGKDYWDGLCTHNPTVLKYKEKYYLYYMGNTGDGKAMKKLNPVHRNNQRIGVAVAESPDGPWKRFSNPVIDVSPDSSATDALMVSNPSVTERPEGGFLMVYKAVGKKKEGVFGGPVVHMVATSESPVGPFVKHKGTIFDSETSDFPAEDPFIWYQDGFYWAIVKDMDGSYTSKGKTLVLFQSVDAYNWKLSEHPLVSGLQIEWQGGEVEKVFHLERPQLWLKDGQPAVLFLAVDKTREHSFNIHVPLKIKQ